MLESGSHCQHANATGPCSNPEGFQPSYWTPWTGSTPQADADGSAAAFIAWLLRNTRPTTVGGMPGQWNGCSIDESSSYSFHSIASHRGIDPLQLTIHEVLARVNSPLSPSSATKFGSTPSGSADQPDSTDRACYSSTTSLGPRSTVYNSHMRPGSPSLAGDQTRFFQGFLVWWGRPARLIAGGSSCIQRTARDSFIVAIHEGSTKKTLIREITTELLIFRRGRSDLPVLRCYGEDASHDDGTANPTPASPTSQSSPDEPSKKYPLACSPRTM